MDSMGYTLNKFIHSVYALQYHLEEATLDQPKNMSRAREKNAGDP
jgi:hypothetical protein